MQHRNRNSGQGGPSPASSQEIHSTTSDCGSKRAASGTGESRSTTSSTPAAPRVVVVGAGFAGLSCACYLAQRGYDVTVLEMHTQVGGRARTFEDQGFTFDMGPSWYWMPDVFDTFFANFQRKTSDYYQLTRLDPAYRVYFGQSETHANPGAVSSSGYVNVPDNVDQLVELFEQRETGAGEKLREFLRDAEYKYRVAMSDYVKRPSLSILEFVDLRLLWESLTRLHMLKSQSKHVARYFKDEILIKLMEWPVLFLGGAPSNVPAMYSMLDHAAVNLGTWYPQGGFSVVSQAMAALARELGVTIHCGPEFEVAEVLVQTQKHGSTITTGIRCKSGQVYPAEAVVGACDYHHFEQHLVPKPLRSHSESYWDRMTMSPSTLLIFMGLDVTLETLEHHNLFFDENLDEHANEIYNDPAWPKRPLFYVCIPSKTDATVAPAGSENLMILIPIAAGLQQDEDEQLFKHYYDIVIDRMQERIQTESVRRGITAPNVKEHVVTRRFYCTRDFERDYHAYKGNAYGLANTLMQTGPFKPACKSSTISNLYYAGHLTVPGPGVPPAILSGEIVADKLDEDQRLAKWRLHTFQHQRNTVCASVCCAALMVTLALAQAVILVLTVAVYGRGEIPLWRISFQVLGLVVATLTGSTFVLLMRIWYSPPPKNLQTAVCRLHQYNPTWDDDVASLVSVMAKGSKSFYAATKLLPIWMHGPTMALYAICRHSDDVVDDGIESSPIDHLRKCYAALCSGNLGTRSTARERCASAVIRAFGISEKVFSVLLDGFEADHQNSVTYNDVSHTIQYGVQVASTVGVMMNLVMGCGGNEQAIARAVDLGIGMQITNICRDVGEDARMGRIYVPRDWLRKAGVDPEQLLQNPTMTPSLGVVVQRLLATADEFYERADTGIDMLPYYCRFAIRAARLIYSDIGTSIRRNGYNSIDQRARTTKLRKLQLLGRAIFDIIFWQTGLQRSNHFYHLQNSLPVPESLELCSAGQMKTY